MTRVQVEVVYALPEKQYQLVVVLEYGNTVEQAIRASGIQKIRPEIDFTTHKVGIYSNLVKLSQVLKEADRIEIYRPLTADPKELRRLRAKYMSGDPNRN